MELKVNKLLLPIKATYFFCLAAVASLLPYMGVYMKQIGLTQSETGIIYGVMPIVGALVRPLIGVIADKAQKHKLTLLLCCIICGAFFAACYFVPEVQKTVPTIHHDKNTSLLCADSDIHLSICTKSKGDNCGYSDNFAQSGCYMVCTNSGIKSGSVFVRTLGNASKPELPHRVEIIEKIELSMNLSDSCTFYKTDNATSDKYSSQCNAVEDIDCYMECLETRKWGLTFWLFLALFLIGNIAFSPIFSLIDAMTYSYLGDQRRKWGKQRLFGTVGFALAAVVAGFMMDTFKVGGTNSNNYIYSFVAYPVFSVCAAIAVYCYKIEADVTCHQMLQNVLSLLRRLDVLAFLIVVQLFGMFTGVIETFLFWHLKTLCAPQILFGISMFVNCLPEVPILFLAGWIMKKIGEINCLFIVFIAYGLRFLGYSLLTNPWFVLILEPLHGVTFGLMYAASSSYGSSITPPGMHGTIQGLIGALHFGTGKGSGSVLAGLAYERYGAVRTFQGCAILAAASLVIYFLLHKLVLRRLPEKEKEAPKEEEMIAVNASHDKEKGELKDKDKKPEEAEPMINGVETGKEITA